MESDFARSRRIHWVPEPPKMQKWLKAQVINWQKVDGLLPAIVQDGLTKQVLMQGFMNREALERSLEIGKVTFYSRTRQKLWCKGETSGNYLLIKELALDCDSDSLLVTAEPLGPTCHLGYKSCYSEEEHSESLGVGWLGALQRIILQRSTSLQNTSYVQKLLNQGIQRVAQKVGEEGVEVALAAMALEAKPQDHLRQELAGEAGDLLFHLLVLLQASGMELQDAIDILEQRHRTKNASERTPSDS